MLGGNSSGMEGRAAEKGMDPSLITGMLSMLGGGGGDGASGGGGGFNLQTLLQVLQYIYIYIYTYIFSHLHSINNSIHIIFKIIGWSNAY